MAHTTWPLMHWCMASLMGGRDMGPYMLLPLVMAEGTRTTVSCLSYFFSKDMIFTQMEFRSKVNSLFGMGKL